MALAASLLAAPAAALTADAGRTRPTGADLAACRAAADQPICLLRLAARDRGHGPYAANIEIGYAPDVLAAIGPEPIDPLMHELYERMARPGRAAVQALIADHAGAPPSEALAPIRAIAPERARDPADQPELDASAANQRIDAYQILWDAGHGDEALPAAHRPSDRLTRAALDAWAAELPKAGGDGQASELAAALRAFGDQQGAERIALPPKASAFDRVDFLANAGRLEEAERALGAIAPPAEAERRFELLMAREFLIDKAVETGRKDIALRIAEAQLDAWFAELADPARRGPAHSGSDVPSDLVLVAQLAPREEAVKWVERMDVAAWQAPSLPAVVSTIAAAQAWTRLGEPARAQALLGRWPAPSEAEIKSCLAGLFKITPECQKSPGAVLALVLKAMPLGDSWDQLMPMLGLGRTRPEPTRSMTDVEADLAKAKTVEARFIVLQTCARRTADEQSVSVTVECARRLASAPAPEQHLPLPNGALSYGERRLDGAISAARQAAESHDASLTREMLDLSFALAAGVPDEQVNLVSLLDDIAIAELRAQGRL